MGLYVPGELTDKIISFVHDEDTLRACALVSRNWLPASRHMLFRTLEVTTNRAYRGLVNNVLRSARMRQCLCSTVTLNIHENDGKPPWDRYPMDLDTGIGIDHPRPRPPDSHSRSFLCDFAGNLPNLESLLLDRCRWDTHLPSPAEPLLASRFPALTDLRLLECSLPSFKFLRRALASFPQLRSLCMNSVTYPPDTSSMMHLPTRSQMLPKLDTFNLSGWTSPDCDHGDLVTWLSQTSSRSSLRTLVHDTVTMVRSNIHVHFLQQVASNITTLTLYLTEEWRKFPMTHFTNLQTLDLSAHRTPPTWANLCSLLREVRSRHLQILRLMNLYTVESNTDALTRLGGPADITPPLSSHLCIDLDDLKELDIALEDEYFFKNLTHVYLLVNAMPVQIESVQEEELVAGIHARLPRLAARGILSLYFFETPYSKLQLKATEAPSPSR